MDVYFLSIVYRQAYRHTPPTISMLFGDHFGQRRPCCCIPPTRLPFCIYPASISFDMSPPFINFLPSMTPCATETGMSFFSLRARRFLSKNSRHNALWPRIKTRPIYTVQSFLAIMHTIPRKAFLTSSQSSQHSSPVCPKTVRSRSQFIVGRSHVPVSRSSPTWNQRTFYSSRFGSSLMGFLLREYFTVYAF